MAQSVEIRRQFLKVFQKIFLLQTFECAEDLNTTYTQLSRYLVSIVWILKSFEFFVAWLTSLMHSLSRFYSRKMLKDFSKFHTEFGPSSFGFWNNVMYVPYCVLTFSRIILHFHNQICLFVHIGWYLIVQGVSWNVRIVHKIINILVNRVKTFCLLARLLRLSSKSHRRVQSHPF